MENQEIKDYVLDFILDDMDVFEGCTSKKTFIEIAVTVLDANLLAEFDFKGENLNQDIQDEFLEGVKAEWKLFKKFHRL